MALQGRQDAAYLRSLPFDQRLARMTLASINPGPDGVESMSQCQCDTTVYEVKEHHIFYDDFKLLRTGAPSSPTTASPLLALPKKVRQKIYAYVVTYPEPIPIREHAVTNTKLHSNTIVRRSWFFCPPLVRTCRKAEKDAAPLFYANNSFKAELTDGDTKTLLAWLSNTNRAYLVLVPELIISLDPRSFFDVESLRTQLDRDGRTVTATAILSKTITESGIGADRIFMVSPADMKHLAKDAGLLGGGVKDVEKLRDQWFDDLQGWLDYDEYEGLTVGEAAGYKLVTGKMQGLLREQ
ncbi:hypothetical protein LTR36_006912 [Oleoguttula mirabilis]|uniref:Uncharacterized protein n=1 Tax=Oleoguttula mirabilis TaxID=1507867 RepID=A0AAV9JB48_9PEZI|nr:hypothetical protein LTR36_006912 [Oleoguttula mirabilis]